MSRPAPIIWFEIMVLASVAWGLVDFCLGYEAMAEVGADGAALSTWMMTSLLVLALGLSISRGGSRTARWGLTGLTMLATPVGFANEAYMSPADWVSTLAPIVATILIWQKSVTDWLNDRPEPRAA